MKNLAVFVFVALVSFAPGFAIAKQISVACNCWLRTEANPRWVYAGHAYGAGASFDEAVADATYACENRPFAAREKALESKLNCIETGKSEALDW